MTDKKKYPWSKLSSQKKMRSVASGVYAGPDFFKKENPDAMMEDVYAGPEPADEEPVDPESVEEPCTEEPKDTGHEEEAPPVPENLPVPPPEMFMCVYAGPEYFNPTPDAPPRGFSGPPSPPPQPDPPAPGERACPICGGAVGDKDPFCRHCGSLLKDRTE